MHKFTRTAACSSVVGAFIYTVMKWVWDCIVKGSISTGVYETFSVVPLEDGLNPYCKIMGLRKSQCSMINIAPQLS